MSVQPLLCLLGLQNEDMRQRKLNYCTGVNGLTARKISTKWLKIVMKILLSFLPYSKDAIPLNNLVTLGGMTCVLRQG